MSNTTPECLKCTNCVMDSQRSICCDSSSFWFHLKCSSISLKDFEHFVENENLTWFRRNCLRNALPSQSLDNNRFVNYLSTQNKIKKNRRVFDKLISKNSKSLIHRKFSLLGPIYTVCLTCINSIRIRIDKRTC